MYAHGEGVKINLVQAYLWISEAARNGVKEAIASQKKIKDNLSLEELKRVDKMLASKRTTT